MTSIFVQVLGTAPEHKGAALRQAIAAKQCGGPLRFELQSASFRKLPRSPFAYWISDRIRDVFVSLPRFEGDGRTARIGASTKNNFRFLRLTWEVDYSETFGESGWALFAKGGPWSPYYDDLSLRVKWAGDAREIEAELLAKFPYLGTNAEFVLHRNQPHFRAGITWPLRAHSFCPQFLPEGCVFSDRGYAAFVPEHQLAATVAIFGSKVFDFFFKIALGRHGFPEFIVGTLQNLPWKDPSPEQSLRLGEMAAAAWSNARLSATAREATHAFVVPALVRPSGSTLLGRAEAWRASLEQAAAHINSLRAAIDAECYSLFGISTEDQLRIEQGIGVADPGDEGEQPNDEEDADADAAEVDGAPMVASLLSWTVGVAFGRFDVRLATGERAAPLEPEPFDPLPVCSPGMLTGDDSLPVTAPPSGYPLTFPTDGILVDDPGHPRDLVRAVRSVFDTVFDDANARWHEAAELLSVSDLRNWFARDFFEPHIKRYSKSRRKAPIYWQLATASVSYSVWLYIHRATGDTLFRVLNDFVGPKLDHEKAKLDGLTLEAGSNPSAAQRREIEQQENFVGELQALKTEVARVAPLWKPNLDDGVILNFAPLWRLVPHSRSWQSECKKAWDKLQSGDYDWAHLAMHLWPERVVPKCIDDRSLAIAHELEDVFWHEDESGTWRKSHVDESTVRKLIADRTSSTVKAALKDLLSAPTPTARGKKNAPRAKGARRKAVSVRPSSARNGSPASKDSSSRPDADLLNKVKEAIAANGNGASKADVIDAIGITTSEWNTATKALLADGSVTQTGERRGARYHLAGGEA